ncbi:DUF58 domain-containing protein [Candidatus Babeliales bacterium]|nr:DUF58 domain-containing protein [Candidatus Babeliales bacterium]
MLAPEVLKKIRQIEITTRRLLSGMYVGDVSTAHKGSGFEFEQIRDYVPNDDVRFIDWKSTARMQRLQVREYIEERNRSIILMVDRSQSMFFSSREQLTHDAVVELAAILALVADYGKDSVGLLIFSNEVDRFIPPARGRAHIHRVMKELFTIQPTHARTSISLAFNYILECKQKNALLIALSDFVDEQFSRSLSLACHVHEIIALRCCDVRMKKLPEMGFITMFDPETQEECCVDVRHVNKFLRERMIEQNKVFKRNGVDVLDLEPGAWKISDMVTFFKRRLQY